MGHTSSSPTEKSSPTFPKKGRHNEDITALSGLQTQPAAFMSEDPVLRLQNEVCSLNSQKNKGLKEKFSEVLKTLPHEDLLKITLFYKAQLVYVIEYDTDAILQNLVTKHILSHDEAKRFKAKEKSNGAAGVEFFIGDMMKKDREVLVSLWMALAEELARFPSQTLTRILEELAEGGPDILNDIQSSLVSHHIKTHIKDLQLAHRRFQFESSRTPRGPQIRATTFNTQYTQLIVIEEERESLTKAQQDFPKTLGTHAELVEEQTKQKYKQIWIEQLFRKSPGLKSSPHLAVVSGVPGIGKTTMVQKILFDWARGAEYQKFAFVFLFKFKELNLQENEKEPKISLTKLIVRHYKHLDDVRLKEILLRPKSLLFIFDGLDEYKHKLDFTRRKLCSNLEDCFPVHVLITSLIRRKLLKGSSILITSRPGVLEPFNKTRVDRFAEILGFFTEQKLMYFKKIFGEVDLRAEAFQYVKENASLYTMCFNPSYCWFTCLVLKDHFTKSKEDRGAAPKTATELFVMFLYNILIKHKKEADDKRGILVKLGKMAYYGVDNGIHEFYQTMEMSAFGLQPFLSSHFLKGILKRQSPLDQKAFKFVHYNLQEFIAACSVFLDPSVEIQELLKKLQSRKDGRFEVITRFLIGLSRPSVIKPLQEILGDFERKPAVQIMTWVKQKAGQALQGEDKSKAVRVLQWLYEYQSKKSVRDVIGKNLTLDIRGTILSPLDCAGLSYVISCCGHLEELNLSGVNLTTRCTRRLAEGLSRSRHVRLVSCGLTYKCCETLSLALCVQDSYLTELDLTDNKLRDSGVHLLCEGMKNPLCKLEKLWLVSCGLTSGCCTALCSALSSEHSHLTALWLEGNKLGDSGIRLLCDGLRNRSSKLMIFY
ncbi:NACHT, LRR and PYD domains-containing protein 3-like isoform X1 [Polypterus senegalus]|uniref:NACHT, LRR and PYD domains-containing protein 3-like isoform X1 n=2 Tax=Polypterus senegalus TaxID=55291 RepID=UPI001965567D|nr:NACHT, LRR and PYD domains-containing protein 3-like isoform X1 [Polypterus senegalus]XP_039617855.1 NACHT, LRR and PYD domains-containing protein 3-like isoform X1 [Polypterus senegalus]XP_039617856.1 NACHT, LRR and PYD domains-containing protein 3-like isoform X1 [Polypterus senegalus]XP_039617858.1 NACHT, LRR and PYD domains-containing protein 3-like isoform X1 [Polypterus senegalus]